MSSKAKSGLSAVRQIPENVLSPPNNFTPGSTTFVSSIRDGKGHAEYHVGAVNNTPFTLSVRHAWLHTGTFTGAESVPSTYDPVSGTHVAEIIAPVKKRFIQAFVNAPSGLGNIFELGIYFQPRASGPTVTSGVGGGGVSTTVGNRQIQNIETETPLAAGSTFNGGERDCLDYEGFSASVHLKGGAVGTTVNVNLQHRHASGVWRTVDSIPLVVAAGAEVEFNRVWSVTRRYNRIQLVNTTANALAETELVTMQKPMA